MKLIRYYHIIHNRIRYYINRAYYGPKYANPNYRAKIRRRKQLAKHGITITQYTNRTTQAKKRILGSRQFGYCVLCRNRCHRKELTIDHRIPISQGGANKKENLQLICYACHHAKDNKVSKQPTQPVFENKPFKELLAIPTEPLTPSQTALHLTHYQQHIFHMNTRSNYLKWKKAQDKKTGTPAKKPKKK